MALVKVYTAADTTQAHFVRTLLEREGIGATVLGDQLALAIGGLPATRGTLPAVWVPEESTDAARAVIDRFESGGERQRAAGEAPWKCPSCGETIEPQFTDCWNCGAARPAGDGTAAADDDDAPREVEPIPADLACLNCGYNLRGLHAAGRCPECGVGIVPSMLALLRNGSGELWDEAEELLRATIAPAAKQIGYQPQAVLFLLDAWLRAATVVEAMDADGERGEPSSFSRRAFAARLCRLIAARAVEHFGGAEDALEVLRGWKLDTCEAIAWVAFAMTSQGFLEPVPHLREDDFPRGSVELLLA